MVNESDEVGWVLGPCLGSSGWGWYGSREVGSFFDDEEDSAIEFLFRDENSEETRCFGMDPK